MPLRNPDGTLKSSAQYIKENKAYHEKLASNQEKRDKTNYNLRAIRVSDYEWKRLDQSIEKLKETVPTGVVKQSIINNILKEFNDKILGAEDAKASE